MLITLLAWLYISFICYAWGSLLVGAVAKLSKNEIPSYGFSITCLAGLAIITSLAGILAFFTGLSAPAVQLIFLLPALLFFFRTHVIKHHANELRRLAGQWHLSVIFLFAALIVMVLFMSAYPITHPDTLAYHAQLIRWAERYRVIPGLVHVDYLYGLQNNWFVVCALFSFEFVGTHALTFVNSTIILWLLLFYCARINNAARQQQGLQTLLWTLLLGMNVWVYPQIRLTITSGSPDFIAAIYILLAAYLGLQKKWLSANNDGLVIFLCLFTVTLKLSALPVSFICIFLLYPFQRTKMIALLFSICTTIVPFMIRNSIVSGYPLFPAPFFDVVHADWKYDVNKLAYINRYILSFARFQDSPNSETLLSTPFPAWVVRWWSVLALSNRIMVLAAIGSLVLLLLNVRQFAKEQKRRKAWMAVAVIGIVFWFVKAPDPRFGAGFLLLFTALVLTRVNQSAQPFAFFKKAPLFVCTLLTLLIASYDVYRAAKYFYAREFLVPAGIEQTLESVYYKQIETAIPLINKDKKNTIVTPAPGPPSHFEFRGTTVEEGFRQVSRPIVK